MDDQKRQTLDQILKNQQVTLVDLLDHLLDTGVMAKGEIVLSVANVELVYLNLGLLLASVKTVMRAAGKQEPVWHAASPGVNEDALDSTPQEATSAPDVSEVPEPAADNQSIYENQAPLAGLRPREPYQDKDEEEAARNLEKSLIKLVVLLVNIIRKLMEKQALRRVEDGQLTEQEIEKVGYTFFLLNERIEELKKVFDLTDDDLDLDLGPLWRT